jgi:hypothetical protein
VKVESVRDLMHSSVKKALGTVEKMEEMEEKSEMFEEQSRTFHKRSKSMKELQKKNYYKITMFIMCVVLGLMAYFIIPAVINYKARNGAAIDEFPPSSSTGMDGAGDAGDGAGTDTIPPS